MACNLAALTSGNIKSLSVTANHDVDTSTDLLSKIRKYTYDLSRTDCPQVVYDYFNRLSDGDLDSANKSVTKLMNIDAWMKKLADYVRPKKNDGTSGEIVDMLCLTINGMYKTAIDFVEKLLKIVPDMFRKIDELRKEIESVLLNFGIEIKNCILNVITAVQTKINSLLTQVIDFTKLQTLMDACPCVTEAMAWLFGCTDNTSSTAVLDCIKHKFGLDASGALGVVNKFFNNILKATIQSVYAALEAAVKYVFKLLMTPIRELVKLYCEALNYKIDLTWFIQALGGAKCFFIYSNETKVVAGVPVKYLGVSVIDIINTFKMWAKCFDGICSFADDIKLDIKKFNENLRLNATFWNDPYTIDIFHACMVPALSIVTDDASTRGVFVTKQDTTKNSLVDLFDTIKTTKKMNVSVYSPYNDKSDTEAMVSTPDPESGTGKDPQNLSGTLVMYDGVEDLLVRLTANIQKGMPNEDYIRLLNLLRMWSYRYKKGNNYINALDEAQNHYNEVTSNGIRSTTVSPTSGYINTSPVISAINLDLEPNYTFDSSIQVYSFENKPIRQSNHTLTDYYADWFNSKTIPVQEAGQTTEQYYSEWTGT